MNIELVKIHIAARIEAREKLYKEWASHLDFDRAKAGKMFNCLKDALSILEGTPPRYATVEQVIWELKRSVYALSQIKTKNASTIEALNFAINFISSTQKIAVSQ